MWAKIPIFLGRSVFVQLQLNNDFSGFVWPSMLRIRFGLSWLSWHRLALLKRFTDVDLLWQFIRRILFAVAWVIFKSHFYKSCHEEDIDTEIGHDGDIGNYCLSFESHFQFIDIKWRLKRDTNQFQNVVFSFILLHCSFITVIAAWDLMFWKRFLGKL